MKGFIKRAYHSAKLSLRCKAKESLCGIRFVSLRKNPLPLEDNRVLQIGKLMATQSLHDALTTDVLDGKWHGLWVEVAGAKHVDDYLIDVVRQQNPVQEVCRNRAVEDVANIFAVRFDFERTINDLLKGLHDGGYELSVDDASSLGVIRMNFATDTLLELMRSPVCENIIHFDVRDEPSTRYVGEFVPLMNSPALSIPKEMPIAQALKIAGNGAEIPVIDWDIPAVPLSLPGGASAPFMKSALS
jgi:hypothetical protein